MMNSLNEAIKHCEEVAEEKESICNVIENKGETWTSVTPQPFINKPCISEGVCHEDKMQVLDKIRAEIAEYGSICVTYAITDKTKTDEGIDELLTDVLLQAKRQVLDIIDKYRSESEE